MFKKFREKILFLKQIPDDIYFNLDFSEFVLPDAEINNLRQELQYRINSFIMIYKPNTSQLDRNKNIHLCSTIKSAELNENQLKILRDYELKVEKDRMIFVAYKKPLVYTKDLK